MPTMYLVWSQMDGFCSGASSVYMVWGVEFVKRYEIGKRKSNEKKWETFMLIATGMPVPSAVVMC